MCFVSGRLKKAGVQLRKPGNPNAERPERRVPTSELESAVKRYLAGESARHIAETGGISKPTLLKELKRQGIAIRLQAVGDEQEIIEAYLSGMSVNQIEKKIGCTKRRASNVLKAANVPFRERTREKTLLSRSLACKRRAEAISRATPQWSDRSAIKRIYNECSQLTKSTGKKFHVDHVLPLRSDIVCGLHVPNNLEIISERKNIAKKNFVDPAELEWKKIC